MNTDISTQIDKSISKVVEYDANKEGNAWGKEVRVRIKIDLLKILSHGRTINVKGD